MRTSLKRSTTPRSTFRMPSSLSILMRWLLDQGLPRSAANLLIEIGHDALHVGDLGMAGAADRRILEKAVELDRILVTLDADFHDLLAHSGSPGPSVLRIREEGLKAGALVQRIDAIANEFESDLRQGCVMTYRNKQVRFRRLPLA